MIDTETAFWGPAKLAFVNLWGARYSLDWPHSEQLVGNPETDRLPVTGSISE